MPKFNLYQSLHTTVIGPGGKPVEIQIRTHDMHRRAEYGVAAHWKYKESAKNAGTTDKDSAGNDMQWLRQLVDWQKETADPSEFLDSLRFEIAGSEVYVFTPKGDVIGLPSGSTPVDFAYAVHTEVGPPHDGRPRQRPPGAARLVARERRRGRRLHVEVRDGRVRRATGSASSRARARATRSASGSPRSAARRRSSTARTPSPRRCASRTCRSSASCRTSRSSALANEMRYADVSALYAAIGEGQVSAAHGRAAARAVDGRRAGGRGGPRRGRPARARRSGGSAPATPASWSRASTTSGSSWPSAAPRCPGDDIVGLRDARRGRERAPHATAST